MDDNPLSDVNEDKVDYLIEEGNSPQVDVGFSAKDARAAFLSGIATDGKDTDEKLKAKNPNTKNPDKKTYSDTIEDITHKRVPGPVEEFAVTDDFGLREVSLGPEKFRTRELTAYIGGKNVGHIIYSEYPTGTCINGFEVAEEARRQGIGGQLWEQVYAISAERRPRGVIVGRMDSPEAVRLREKKNSEFFDQSGEKKISADEAARLAENENDSEKPFVVTSLCEQQFDTYMDAFDKGKVDTTSSK